MLLHIYIHDIHDLVGYRTLQCTLQHTYTQLGDQELVTNYRQGGGGGLHNESGRGGGYVKLYRYVKGGRKSFSHAKVWGKNKFWGSFYVVA